jgi:hypothetical protein
VQDWKPHQWQNRECLSSMKLRIPHPLSPGRVLRAELKDAITGSITSATTFRSSDIHLPSDWDLATLPNKSFVS